MPSRIELCTQECSDDTLGGSRSADGGLERRPSKEVFMPTYVVLARFTDQGFKVVKDTVKRTEAFKQAAKKQGAEVKEFVWTMGDYDMVTIIEAPDDETMSAVMLNALKSGNIIAHTLRAFSSVEMERVLAKVA
jgi:uncharacterized protein with GYD domain